MAWETPAVVVTGEVIEAAWGNAVRNSLLETAAAKAIALGDLFVGTGANGLKRLPLGADGRLLRVSNGDVAWGVGLLRFTESLSRIQLVSGGHSVKTITLTGVEPGDRVVATPGSSNDFSQLMWSESVSASDTVKMGIFNASSTSIDTVGTSTWEFTVFTD